MSRKKQKNTNINKIISIIVLVLSAFATLYINNIQPSQIVNALYTQPNSYSSLKDIPEYSGSPYVVLNGNIPEFEEKSYQVFESYSDLDYLGRCGVAFANLGIETMPTEDRESISHIKPTGWQSVQYDVVDGKYLYNRCHLIGFQLSSENANDKNLITGTRYFNVDGMLPFENQVAEYIEETNNHVLYRVTPIYEGNDLVAQGVQIEAKSLEDNGSGVLFNVYVYNIQPDIIINYSDGSSSLNI